MADGDIKKYYWLKLKKDFFKRHDTQIIESMPNGKDYLIFYLKLLCESLDHEGALRFSDEIPYDEQMLATITNTNIDVVRTAITLFVKLHFIEILDDGTYFMNKVQDMIGSETGLARRLRESRKRKKEQMLQEGSNEVQMNLENRDKSIENRDKSIDISSNDDYIKSDSDAESSKNTSQNLETEEIFKVWNQGKSLIHHKENTDVRKKAISKALKVYKPYEVIEAIQHYDLILTSKYYFNYKWSLEDFLNQKNALPTFMEEGSNWCNFQEELKKNPYLLPKENSKRETPKVYQDFLNSI